MPVAPSIPLSDPDLAPDCARCAGLCCAAPPFARSADFPFDKAAGVPCPNLGAGYRCGVHGELRALGFRGCASFECFGAGQRVTQHTFQGGDWRAQPELAAPMFQVFSVVYSIHGLLWHLDAARRIPAGVDVYAALERLQIEVAPLALGTPEALLALDLGPLREQVNTMLIELSAAARAPAPRKSRRGGMLMGAKLAGKDLRRVDLFGAILIGADLRGADLRGADLRGVDLRGADLSGADLRDALFLTQSQLHSARGDGATKVSAPLVPSQGWAG